MSVFFFSLQQITDLKKENFNLKLRIYFMEERMQQRLGDGDDVFKIVRCSTKFPSNKFLSRQMVEEKHLNLLNIYFKHFNILDCTTDLLKTCNFQTSSHLIYAIYFERKTNGFKVIIESFIPCTFCLSPL